MENLIDFFGPPIHVVTRAQLIEDGMLVDLMDGPTAKLVREAGFKFPIAMTATAFNRFIWPVDDDQDAEEYLQTLGQDATGRLWDVLSLLYRAIKRGGGNPTQRDFSVSLVDWQTRRRQTLALKALCGPGDDGEPVITILLPQED